MCLAVAKRDTVDIRVENFNGSLKNSSSNELNFKVNKNEQFKFICEQVSILYNNCAVSISQKPWQKTNHD